MQLNLKPRSIMIDFEQRPINAFHQTFSNASQRVCFFHLSRFSWRRIQKTGRFVEKYAEDFEFALNIRHLPTLAFVPVSDVFSSFEELIESEYFERNEQYLQPIIDHFTDILIGHLDR